MKSKFRRFITYLTLLVAVTLSAEESGASAFRNKVLDLNARNTDLVEVLSLIAMKGGLRLDLSSDVKGRVSADLKDVTLQEAVSELATAHGFEYYLQGNTLHISKKGGATTGGAENVAEIRLKYTSALDITGKVDKFLDNGEKIIVDERNNSLVFYGSKKTENRLKAFINIFDRMPKQIVIESQIVETSKNFLRDIGFGWGTIDNPGLGADVKTGGIVNAPGPGEPNLALRKTFGSIDGATLAVKLAAAESSGNATIISRPKVITLNNRTAKIKSGITYHVKTLSAVNGSVGAASGTGGTAAGTSGSTVTGGLQSVEAGLQLDVTPTLVGEEMVQMTIVMNNSTPDKGVAVDGIPGINSSSADTSVVVKQGHTAILAGLVKTFDSLSKNGVPILSDIPILGILFSSRSEEKRNNEIVIFMTPLIIESPELLNQSEHMKYRKLQSDQEKDGHGTSGT